MTLTPVKKYHNNHTITILFDTNDPRQAALFRAFETSFGEKYTRSEELGTAHYRCLNVLPGGALEARPRMPSKRSKNPSQSLTTPERSPSSSRAAYGWSGAALSVATPTVRPRSTSIRETGSWYCFGACARGGDIIDLCQAVEGGETWEAMIALATRYDVRVPERPPSWFERQSRQRPVCDALEEMRIERVRRRLMRWIVTPEIAGIPDSDERAEEAALAWDGLLPVARMMVTRLREDAR